MIISKHNWVNVNSIIFLPLMMKLFDWYACVYKVRFGSAHISNMATLVCVGSRLSIQKNIIVANLISYLHNPYMFVKCVNIQTFVVNLIKKVLYQLCNRNIYFQGLWTYPFQYKSAFITKKSHNTLEDKSLFLETLFHIG